MKSSKPVLQGSYAFRLGVMALIILGLAVSIRDDVKAGLKLFGIELFLETKDLPSKEQVEPVSTQPPPAKKGGLSGDN